MLRRPLFAACLLVACRGVEPGGGGGAGGAAEGGSPLGGGGAGGEGPSPDLTLLTWNLESFPKSSQTIERVAETLADLEPDLVTVQEIGEDADWQALDLALEDYQGVLASSGDGFVRVAFLYRQDRVAVSNVELVFGDDGYAFPRPMLAAHVARLDRPDEDFLLGVVHLKAQLDEASADRRRAACRQLDEWIRQQQNIGVEAEVVIAGDFNDQLTDPPHWNVFGPLLDAPDGGFVTYPAELAGDYTYIPFQSFIDHVHVRGAKLSAESTAEVVPLDQTLPGYTAFVSDHRPILATLRFSP